MQRLCDELEEKTQLYWRISQQNNNPLGGPIETGEALMYCSDVMYSTNQARPIVRQMEKLREEIIIGVGTKFEAPAQVLNIKHKAQAG